MDVGTGVELECSYGAGDGWTRSRVASMPKERSGRPRLDQSCDWEKCGYDTLGGSISTHTTIRPALLLLLVGKFGVAGLHFTALSSFAWGPLPPLREDMPFCLKESMAALTIPSSLRFLILSGEVWLSIWATTSIVITPCFCSVWYPN